MLKCALCKDKIDLEHPDTIYDKNPKTNRNAYMHTYCYKIAIEELKDTPSKSTHYENKVDEYYSK